MAGAGRGLEGQRGLERGGGFQTGFSVPGTGGGGEGRGSLPLGLRAVLPLQRTTVWFPVPTYRLTPTLTPLLGT